MIQQKYVNAICCFLIVLAMGITGTVMVCAHTGQIAQNTAMGYENRLLDASRVHTLNIVMEDWETWVESCSDEEYTQCSVIIDNEAYTNVGIRAKGNTSLSNVANYGNNRYSFKIEFDHYDPNKTYYGLDKLSLNNIIQDNTYMKDFLTYQMMNAFQVNAPLCSYVHILVNGEEWGLYLAVEGVEDAFLDRNFSGNGDLYKPDSMTMGGGRGQGKEFNMEDWQGTDQNTEDSETQTQPAQNVPNSLPEMQANSADSDQQANQETGQQMPAGMEMPMGMQNNPSSDNPGLPDANETNSFPGQSPDAGQAFPGENAGGFDEKQGQGNISGSSDVSLIYTDDNVSSYSNIFENAKTDVSDADQARLIESLRKLNSNEDISEVVNVDEVIRYFAVHNFVCNFDSYTGSMIHNYYLYEENGQLSMIPWDYNLAFGGFESQSDAASLVNYPIDTPVSGGDVDSRPMLAWIFASEEYTELYHTYLQELITDFFSSGTIPDLIASTAEMISPYVESDPTKFCTYEEFEAGVSTLKQFTALRAQSIQGQLDGTIGSTKDSQDSSTLIDASSLNISNMGSMNGGGNMGAGGTFQMQPGGQPGAMQNALADEAGKFQMPGTEESALEQPDMNGNSESSDVSSDPAQQQKESSSDQAMMPADGTGSPFDPQNQEFPAQEMVPQNRQESFASVSDAPADFNIENTEPGADVSSSAAGQIEEGTAKGQQKDQTGQTFAAPGKDQEMMQPGQPAQENEPDTGITSSAWISLGISGVVLIIGLAAAILYKKTV